MTDAHYKEGATVQVFDYKDRKCAIGLCGDAFGGAAHFLGGKIEVELPIFRNGILYVTI